MLVAYGAKERQSGVYQARDSRSLGNSLAIMLLCHKTFADSQRPPSTLHPSKS